jgi:hypothetical protein
MAETNDLLLEMRDLLRVIAEASLPGYRQTVLARLGARAEKLRSLVKTDAQWDALELMNGRRLKAELAAAVGIDPSNFNKFVARVAAEEFASDGERGPTSLLSRWELRAVREPA